MNIAKASTLACIAAAASLAAQAVTQVDVMFAFDTTSVAAVEADGTTLQAFAEGQIAKSNEVLANSGLAGDFEFRLVGTHEWSFTQGPDEDLFDTLMSTTNATAASEMHAARNDVGADIVVVVVKPESSSANKGIGYAMAPEVGGVRQQGLDFEGSAQYLTWFSDMAYCVVDYESSRDSYTVVHEMGHVMGAGHSDAISETYAEPGPQLYPYSSGWMMQGSDGDYYATVMGYDRTGFSDSPHYTVLPYFSSPALTYNGDKLGDADHDNVTTLRNTYAAVSNFRESKISDGGNGGASEGGNGGASEGGNGGASEGGNGGASEGGNGGASEGGNGAVIVRPPAGLFTEKKTIIDAALMDNGEVVGVVSFTVSATRKGISKVSGTVIGLDGKKKKIRSTKCSVYGDNSGVAFVDLEGAVVKGLEGTLSVTLGSDGSLTDGSIGKITLVPAAVGMSGAATSAYFWLDEQMPSIMGEAIVTTVYGEDVVYSTLPYADSPEQVTLGAKWSVAKPSKIKLTRDRTTGESRLMISSMENLSGLKLNYQAKTGTFKGSFTVYALNDAGKLKKYKFNVTGVVVNDQGYGIGVCKKAGVTVQVSLGQEPFCNSCQFFLE